MSGQCVELLDVLAAVSWADLAAVHEASARAAYAHIFDTAFPREEADARWRGYGGSVTAAVLGGRVIGFAAWSEHLLDALYVLPEDTGRGIGAQLLRRVPGRVRQVWVLVGNERGRRFYEAQGWVSTGVVRPAYEPVMEILYRR